MFGAGFDHVTHSVQQEALLLCGHGHSVRYNNAEGKITVCVTKEGHVAAFTSRTVREQYVRAKQEREKSKNNAFHWRFLK